MELHGVPVADLARLAAHTGALDLSYAGVPASHWAPLLRAATSTSSRLTRWLQY